MARRTIADDREAATGDEVDARLEVERSALELDASRVVAGKQPPARSRVRARELAGRRVPPRSPGSSTAGAAIGDRLRRARRPARSSVGAPPVAAPAALPADPAPPGALVLCAVQRSGADILDVPDDVARRTRRGNGDGPAARRFSAPFAQSELTWMLPFEITSPLPETKRASQP